MRKQFVKSLKHILHSDNNSTLLLGDIGVFAFREELKNIPNRVFNIGILEQATIGIAAGMAKTKLIPFIHTIAPFLVERAYEQLKIDFGYQNLNGNFISIGASYDYAALGCTHHCPGDISILSNIPNMQIICPGTSEEFDYLIQNNYNNGSPSYYRLSEYENLENHILKLGEGKIIKSGSKATVLCFGNILSTALKALSDLDVTILYYNSVQPFDINLLINNLNKKIIIIEPFYEGSVNYQLAELIKTTPLQILNIGIQRKFLYNYGTKEEHDINLNLDEAGIRNRITTWIQ
jgi:transketolase